MCVRERERARGTECCVCFSVCFANVCGIFGKIESETETETEREHAVVVVIVIVALAVRYTMRDAVSVSVSAQKFTRHC